MPNKLAECRGVPGSTATDRTRSVRLLASRMQQAPTRHAGLAAALKDALAIAARRLVLQSSHEAQQHAGHRPSVLRAHDGHDPVVEFSGAGPLLAAAGAGLAGAFVFGGEALTATGIAAFWGVSSPALVTSATAWT